jgi:hypothetical protein
MRQICPHCHSAVDVPDSATGGNHDCPVCHRVFPVSRAYTPTVDPTPVRLAPPPPAAPSPPRTEKPLPPPGFVVSAPAPSAGEYTKTCGVSLTPTLCDWLPVACLTLVFFLTMFAWVVVEPGDVRAYWQSPWGSATRGFGVNEDADKVFDAKKEIDKHLHTTWLFLWPYLFGLLAAVVLAWADRLHEIVKPSTSPLWAEQFLPYMSRALLVLAGVLFFLVLIQTAIGFGLDSAVTEAKVEATKKITGRATDPDEKAKVPYLIAQSSAFMTTEGTTARCLALWLHAFALAGLAGRVWLERRGTKPLPRVEVKW